MKDFSVSCIGALIVVAIVVLLKAALTVWLWNAFLAPWFAIPQIDFGIAVIFMLILSNISPSRGNRE